MEQFEEHRQQQTKFGTMIQTKIAGQFLCLDLCSDLCLTFEERNAEGIDSTD